MRGLLRYSRLFPRTRAPFSEASQESLQNISVSQKYVNANIQ